MYLEQFRAFLDEYSTKKYNIIYGSKGFFNHMSHGLIALFNLGADKERLTRFVKWYEMRLDVPQGDKDQGDLSQEDLEVNKGQRKGFYPLCGYYQDQLDHVYKGDMEAALRGELPRLASGMLSAAFHGIIHLGYGFMTKNARVFVEGFATIHYFHVDLAIPEDQLTAPLDSQGDLDIIQVLLSVRENSKLINNLYHTASDPTSDIAEKFKNKLLRRAAILLTQCPGDVMRHVDRIRMPPAYQRIQQGDYTGVRDLCKWIIDSSIKMYTFADTVNDFLFLHVVTSAWCLRYLLCSMSNVEDINKLTRVFLFGVITTYIVQGCPNVREIEDKGCEDNGDFWKDTIKQAMCKTDTDEHIYKLLDVCRTTSLYNEDKQMEHVYRKAVQNALNNQPT